MCKTISRAIFRAPDRLEGQRVARIDSLALHQTHVGGLNRPLLESVDAILGEVWLLGGVLVRVLLSGPLLGNDKRLVIRAVEVRGQVEVLNLPLLLLEHFDGFMLPHVDGQPLLLAIINGLNGLILGKTRVILSVDRGVVDFGPVRLNCLVGILILQGRGLGNGLRLRRLSPLRQVLRRRFSSDVLLAPDADQYESVLF